jgi:dihydrofolate reductase
VFAEALPLSDRVYLTLVHANVEGDTRFPLEALDGWRLSDDKRRESDEKNPYALSFRVYDRP